MIITMLVAAEGVNRTLLQRLLGGWAFALALLLLLVTGLAPLLQTNLRAEPTATLHATDASPSGAGGCDAPTTQEAWLAWYDKEILVRPDWKGEEPPSNMHGGRAAAAPLALKLDWDTMFSYRFFQGQAHQSLGTEELDQPPLACHA